LFVAAHLLIMELMASDVEPAPSPSWIQTVLIGRNPKRTAIRIVILVALCLIVFNRFVLVPIRVEGLSMMPTYQDHRINFVNRLAYDFHKPQRGDVVAIRTSGISIMYMKRVIGLPGETVTFHEGHAYIDGELLNEPYVKTRCDWELPPRQLGPDEYFLVGDNRSMPASDHTMGVAPRQRIVGKVLL
jgi:signal peptidase I